MRKKWEYLTLGVTGGGKVRDAYLSSYVPEDMDDNGPYGHLVDRDENAALKALGNEGWELVQIIPVESIKDGEIPHDFYFKREAFEDE